MAAEKSNVTEAPEDRSLKLTRVFDAPRHLVFEACTKQEHMNVWMCPRGFTVPESSGDFREGGAWSCVMVRPDGGRMPLGGVYEKIVADKLLIFTHAWMGDDGQPEHWTKVTMLFEDAGEGKTRLTLEQAVFKSVESRDGHVGGWTECLDKLAEVLAAMKGKS